MLDNIPKLKKLINPDLNILNFRLRERYFDETSLTDYISTNNCNFKNLIFQVIHTLAIIQNKYPNFRHNDLSVDNIFIYKKVKEGLINNYIFKGKKYYVPSNFDIKIGNFESASLNDKKNKYYDIFYFLKSLLDKIGNLSDKCSELSDFMNRILPIEFRNQEKMLKNNVELITAEKLLEDKYFDSFVKVRKRKKTLVTLWV